MLSNLLSFLEEHDKSKVTLKIWKISIQIKKKLKSDELNIENRFIDETSILVFE